MRDGKYSRILELLTNELLDLLLCHYVDACCGLIEHHNLVLTQNSSTEAYELALADRQVAAILCNPEVDASLFKTLLGSLTQINVAILLFHTLFSFLSHTASSLDHLSGLFA